MYLLLVNPKAGNQRYRRIERALVRLLDKLNIKHQIVLLDDLANTADLLKQNLKTNTKAVVAVGGNGTVNTIIDALADYRDLPLGIIPLSKSNYLAKTLGITSWTAGVRLLSQHKVKHLRLGKIGERYFAGSLTVSPKRTLLARFFEQRSVLRNFLGANVRSLPKEEHHVGCTLKLDRVLTVRCQLHTLAIYFQDDLGKKIKIHLFTLSDKQPQDSIFHANQIDIESSLNMPVLCGNDTVANTPISIRAINQTLPVLAPVSPVSSKDKPAKNWLSSTPMLVSKYIAHDSTTTSAS